MTTLRLALAAVVLLAGGVGPAAARVGGDYVLTADLDLGAPGAWDLVTAEGGRAFVAHHDKMSLADPATGAVSAVGPIADAHGVAVVPGLGKGYATSGEDGVVHAFTLKDGRIVATIPAAKDADGALYDPATRRVVVLAGDAKQALLIDPATDTVARTIALPEEPELGVADGEGRLFVNLVNSAQLARIDLRSGKVEAVWPLTGCQRPHGIAYDPRTRRLFSGCANKVMVVADPDSGRIVASLPIGAMSDGVGVDSARGLAFSSNGEGTLTVIAEKGGDAYAVLRTLPTFVGARTMAVDPRSGVLYLVHGTTTLKSGPRSPGGITFGWTGARLAVFTPND